MQNLFWQYSNRVIQLRVVVLIQTRYVTSLVIKSQFTTVISSKILSAFKKQITLPQSLHVQ